MDENTQSNDELKRKRELANARLKKHRKRKEEEAQQRNLVSQDEPDEQIQQDKLERRRELAVERSRRYRDKKRLCSIKSAEHVTHDSQICGTSNHNSQIPGTSTNMTIPIVINDYSENENDLEENRAGPSQEENLVERATREDYLLPPNEVNRQMNIDVNLAPLENQINLCLVPDSPKQSGALNNSQQSSNSSDLTDSSNMPQQQGPRATATVHPYNVDARMTRQAAMYNQNLYQQYQHYQKPQQNVLSNSYPVHPDVKFKRLPFFDVIADLLKPSSLVPQNNQRLQDGTFYFHLTPQQATYVASSRDIRPGSKCEYIKQVQLRFCLLETTCEQEDYFPPNVVVKVNNKLCPLPNPIPTNKPGVEPKRPPRPVNITPMVKLSPTVANAIHVQWAADYGRGYAITVVLVHKRNSNDLLLRLKNRGVKHSDHTRGLIKEKLNEDADGEIATTCLRVSLMCPLGKMRMSTPCRAITCQHLQCFDASLFLQMNERKPTWNCPVCDKPALYDNLVIDGYFQEVLGAATAEVTEIQLHKDGSWSTQITEKKAVARIEKVPDDSIEIISDDVEVVSSGTNQVESSSSEKPKEESAPPQKEKEVVDLTLSDSDDDDEPLAKRRALNPKPDSTIKFSDTTSVSSSSNQSRVTSTPGPSSVSSSGYPASPSVINLDSPSPPRSPQNNITIQPIVSQPPSCMMMGSNGVVPESSPIFGTAGAISMPFLDLESEANNGSVYNYNSC